jgi:hypothetical protein
VRLESHGSCYLFTLWPLAGLGNLLTSDTVQHHVSPQILFIINTLKAYGMFRITSFGDGLEFLAFLVLAAAEMSSILRVIALWIFPQSRVAFVECLKVVARNVLYAYIQRRQWQQAHRLCHHKCCCCSFWLKFSNFST